MTALQKPKIASADYARLLKRVEEVLLKGQQEIEAAKVRTYWQAGKYIHEHILQLKDRAEYGSRVLKKLAVDLDIAEDVLSRALRFHRAFPISAARRKLTWTHFRELIKISDEDTRIELAERAEKSKWTSRELAGKIRLEARNGNGKHSEPPSKPLPKLIPRLGELYTYRIIKDAGDLQNDSFLRVDLGFDITHWLSPNESKNLKAGDIVESVRDQNGEYSLKKSARKETEANRTAQSKSADGSVLAHSEQVLFTYNAQVLRVVDGDTLYVRLDFGFKIEQKHYLRLRGINCPEMDTDKGKQAKRFVENQLKKVKQIILTSSKSDKYGRYLADVWIPTSPSVISTQERNLRQKDLSFLNQKLLDEGLAGRM